MRTDGELLAGVIAKKDFFEAVFQSDSLDDWELAKSLGEFLVRIEPTSEIIGHAIQVRAYRHLGELERARNELRECQSRIEQRGIEPWETALILPLLQDEERLLLYDKFSAGGWPTQRSVR